MRLRMKLFLVLVLISVVSAAIYFLVFGYAAYNGTIRLERKLALLHAERNMGLFQREIDLLSLFSSSLVLTDTPAIFEKAPALAANAGGDQYDFFQNNNLNLLQIYDMDGKLIGGNNKAVTTDGPLELSEFSQGALPPMHPLLAHAGLHSEKSGLYLTKNAMLLLSSRPLPDWTKPGQRRGTLIIARLLTEDFDDFINNKIKIDANFSIVPPHAIEELSDIARLRQEMKSRGTAVTLEKETNRFVIHQSIPTLNSTTDALLETVSPNIIHGLIDKNIYLILLVFLLIGLLSFTGLLTMTQMLFVRPLRSLTEAMVSISDTQSLPALKELNRRDEIGMLAREFSNVLRRLNAQTREIKTLSELDNLLAASEDTKEASAVITNVALALFPESTGALSVLNASRNLYSTLSHWGEQWSGELAFAPNDCWALRRGQEHVSDKSTPSPVCHHLPKELDTPVLCYPLMAQGETLGVLHIAVGPSGGIEPGIRRLAAALSEHTSLALANLRLRDALRFQSVRDPLTGLYNRRYLEESLEREIGRAERRQTTVSVLMLDIDHFKRFNDSFGHDAGDYVLKQLGLVMKSFVRKEDIACRYGGEEFTFILPETDQETAQRRAQQFCERVRTLDFRFQDKSLGVVTVSIGVSSYPRHGTLAEGLLAAADSALYRAKKEGRDRIVAAV